MPRIDPNKRSFHKRREMHIQSLKYPTFLISQVNRKNILLDNFYCISEVLLSYLSNSSPTLTLQHWNPLRSRWSDEISDEGGVDSGCSSSLRPPRRPPRRKIRPRQRPASISSAFWGGIHLCYFSISYNFDITRNRALFYQISRSHHLNPIQTCP